MTRDDLMSMLDLDGRDGPGAGPDALGRAGPGGGPGCAAAPAGPQCLELDQWAEWRGRDLAEQNPGAGLGAEGWADFHAAAFDRDPALTGGCADALRYRYVSELLESPEYRALHASTRLDGAASELAAAGFARGFAELRDREGREAGKPARPGRPDPAAERARAEGRAAAAAGRAVEAAADEVRTMREATLALGLGHGPGEPGRPLDPRAVLATYRRVRGSYRLRRVVEEAGRYTRVAQSRQRAKSTHGVDDVVGVTLGGEVGRLIAGETARLCLPGTRLDTLRRLVEHQAQVVEYRGSEPQGKGPVVVVVDESGSMRGHKIESAKGLALAMAYVARRQRRWCALIGFAGEPVGNVLALPPGRWDEAALMDWAEHFYGGGTDLGVPLHELPFNYWPDLVGRGLRRGKTDVLIVTDAICHAPAPMVEAFNAWKAAERVRLHTIVVGAGRAGDLARVSDAVHLVPALGPGTDAAAAALSV